MTVPSEDPAVVGGADTHADTIHVAVVSVHGDDLADREFPTTTAGYRGAISFLTSHGPVEALGIEGTSSYGAGLARAAKVSGLRVVEVNRPDRAERRRRGKSDPIDAYQAAHAVLSGRATTAPKDEAIEGIRALHNARHSAVKARTAAINQIHQMLITSPDSVRTKYGALKGKSLLITLAGIRAVNSDPVVNAVLASLKALAKRCQFLTQQHTDLGALLDAMVTATNPGLRAAYGLGPDTTTQLLITAGGNPERLRSEASFAALRGVAPVPASSGKITRHRLSRGGDRAANNALYRITMVRMSSHATTQAYVARQITAHKTKAEIIRMLKRAIAREVFRYLSQHIPVPEIADLRPTRQAKNITLTHVANHFGVWPMVISRIERGTRRDDDLANAYRSWLNAA